MNTRLLWTIIVVFTMTATNTFGIMLHGFTTQTWNFETQASIDMPNILDFNKPKEALTAHCLLNNDVFITTENGSTASFNGRTITYETYTLPNAGWTTLKEYWIITPQPNFKNTDFTYQEGDWDVDSIAIETRTPTPINSHTLFVFGRLIN